MANEDRIVQRISLEGAEDVQKKLQTLGAVGKDALKNVSQYSADASSGIGRFGATLSSLSTGAAAAEVSASKFREAIHVLHPILETAGLGMGNLGSFSRVAGAGLTALGVAIAGSIIAGLAKLADSAQAAKTKITDLGDPKLFDKAREQANKLGIDVGTILPAVSQGQIARRGILQNAGIVTAPGSEAGPLNATQNVAAVGTITQALRAGGATTEEAGQAATRFFTQLQEQGKLTVQSVDELAKVAPRAADALARSFGIGLQNYQQLEQAIARGQINDGIVEIYRNLERFGSSEAFKKQAEDARPFEAALDRVGTAFKTLLGGASGQGGLNVPAAGTIDFIRKFFTGFDTSPGEANAGLYQAGGGFISGPGSSTSDSIPAMLSDGEYVMRAAAVKKFGVGFMDAVNRGQHFASGGAVSLGMGNYAVVYDPVSGGAFVNGVLRMPGDPLLENPIIKAALERSKASMGAGGSSGRPNPFGSSTDWGFNGRFGGDEGYAAGGLVSRLLPHFASGGLASSLSGGAMPGYGTIDLRTNHGTFRAAATKDVVTAMHDASVRSAVVRGGPSPSWRR